MPRVVGPLLSESAVGTLGGLLFRAGTYGPIVSRSSSAPAVRTPRQSAQRGALKRAHNSWNTLSPANQASWALAAAPSITARNAYVAAHVRLALVGSMPHPHFAYNRKPDRVWGFRAEAYSNPTTHGQQLITTWLRSGAMSTVLRILVLQTWSRRALPKPAKFIFRAYKRPNEHGHTIQLPMHTPVVWVRVEQMDTNTGLIIAVYLFQAHVNP